MSDSSSIPSRPATPVSALPELPHTARPYRFTWDPSSRRPGPESVSGTTEGRGGGDYFSAQPRLAFLNTASTASLALGALPQDWSSSKHGFHAISTVLNNPHKRQAPPKAHSSLPAVVPADLPRVRRKDFDSYLRAITPEWERFQANTELGRDGVPQLGTDPSTPRASTDNTPAPYIPHSTPGGQLPPLETVPSVFFQPQFNLGDPHTFNAVTEQSPESDANSDPTALAHALPLLDKFSHYADTVEQHLVLEISRRAPSFFAALTNLHDLRAESEQCLERISTLRTLLTSLDENGAKRGLEVVRREAHVANLATVARGVKTVSGVVEMGKVARGLVGAGQWGEALGVIEEMERLWEGESSIVEDAHPVVGNPRISSLPEVEEEPEQEEAQDGESKLDEEDQTKRERPQAGKRRKSTDDGHSIPLSALRAYSSLPDHLRALTMEIASSLTSELVSVLKSDLVERISQGRDRFSDGNGSVETGKSNGDGDGGLNQGLRDRLRPLLQGLVRTRGMKEGMLSWREIVLGEIRGVVKSRLPGIDAEGVSESPNQNQNSKAGLANHLRNMPHTDFMLLIQDIYLSYLNGIEGLQEQGRVILDIFESVPSPHKNAPDTSASIQEQLADILSSAAELSNTQAAKVISLRADQHAALELADFLVFFNESWGFVVRCEVSCRRMIVGLRGVVVSQAKVFLQAFHQARISRSAKLVEDEQWNPAEISPSLQHITDVIIDSAVRDAPELVIKSDADTLFSKPHPSADGPGSNGGTTTSPPPARAPPPPKGSANGFSVSTATGSKHLQIDERTYFAVSATAEVLVLLLDYLRVVVNLSMLTTDTMSRVIEFLKAFNSRTCQVVLGAGAMRSAGLKNITAKHLALASQSLSIMFELIPYVRETFRRHLSQKQAVMLVEFDKLKRDYQEHQNEIHSKLIAIMGDRLTAHIKTLQTVDWNVPKPGGGVNDYIEILVKETVTLHKVLSRYLSVPVVEYVMTQVFAAINHGLSEEYGKIDLPHQEAKTRLLADAKYLHQKLSALKNVGTPSGMLVTVISEKSIPRNNTVPTPTRSSSLSANQRLKGLLSGKSPTFDKALPTLMRAGSAPDLPPLPKSTSPPTINGEVEMKDAVNGRSASEKRIPTPPLQERKQSTGFKQVEMLPLPEPKPTPESEPSPDVIEKVHSSKNNEHPTTPTLPPSHAPPESESTMGLDVEDVKTQGMDALEPGAQSLPSIVEDSNIME